MLRRCQAMTGFWTAGANGSFVPIVCAMGEPCARIGASRTVGMTTLPVPHHSLLNPISSRVPGSSGPAVPQFRSQQRRPRGLPATGSVLSGRRPGFRAPASYSGAHHKPKPVVDSGHPSGCPLSTWLRRSATMAWAASSVRNSWRPRRTRPRATWASPRSG